MDLKLLAWARRRPVSAIPALWLFTDGQRLPDPRASVAALPRGRAGVILRHDHDPARSVLGRDLARICRARRLALVVAGDLRLAASLHAGIHLRGGRWPSPLRPNPAHANPSPGTPGRPARLVTSSVHSAADLLRAQQAGAVLVFLSPAFSTASHADAPGLGTLRWAALAHHARTGTRIGALGGINGITIARLPRRLCHAAGAIGALSAPA
jgi:thiamine-phosphate pyrophosphorylase